jgi:peptidyl-prolyl cis-trans isomerase C
MKKFATFAAASALAMVSSAATAQDVSQDTVVATVNGTEITLGHMIIAYTQLPAQYQQLPAEVLWDGLTDQLVQQTLLADALTEMTSRGQKTIDNEVRQIRAGELLAAIADEQINEAAIQAAYDDLFADASPEAEYNASHILVASEEEALAVQARADAGEDFAALARELSPGPSGPNGGELGWFGAGMMVSEFETAVMNMDVGTVSAPVQTQFGWHVIKLNDMRDKPLPTLDEMRDQLIGQLQDTLINQKIEELTADAVIVSGNISEFDPSILSNVEILKD